MRCSVLVLLFVILCCAPHVSYGQTSDSAVRYYQLGHEKMKLGDWQGAAEDFTKAIELNAYLRFPKRKPKDVSGHGFDGPQAEPSEISVSDPFTAAAYHSRAIARANLGELDEAAEDYQRALRIKPKWAEAYLGLGYVKLDKQDFADAIVDFSHALKLKPTLVSAHHARGTAFMKAGRMEPAVVDFTSAIKLDPGMAEAYGNRGLALIVLGRDAAGQTDLDKCIELRPELKSDLERRIELARKLKIQP